MSDLFTFTRRGNKNALLVYDKNGQGEVLASLRVSSEVFWQKLGEALNITFTQQGKPIKGKEEGKVK